MKTESEIRAQKRQDCWYFDNPDLGEGCYFCKEADCENCDEYIPRNEKKSPSPASK